MPPFRRSQRINNVAGKPQQQTQRSVDSGKKSGAKNSRKTETDQQGPNRNAKASEKSEKAPVKSRLRKKTVNEREQNVGKRKTFSNDQKENSETDEDFLKLNQASGKTASKTNANCKQNKEMAPLRNSRKKNVKASSSSNQMRVDSSTGSDHNESTKEDIKRSAYFIKRESTETFSESNQKQENKRLADSNQRKRAHERKAKNSKVKLEQDEKYVESDSEDELMDEPSTSSAKRIKVKPKRAVKKQKPTSDQAKSLALSRNKTSTVSSSSSSGSEDEWEEMEEIDEAAEEVKHHRHQQDVEVTIERPKKPEESEESKWAKFLRQEVNRQILKRQINCHKMHLLCYVAHLRVWMRSLVRSEYLSAQCLSLIPEGYVQSAQLSFDTASVERFMKWFHSAFVRKDLTIYLTRSGFCDAQVERLGMLISDKVYETPKDIASILVLCLLALKQSVRLCLSCYPISHKPDLKSLAKSNEKKENEASSSKADSSKTSNRTGKESTKDNATSAELNESASEVDWTPKSKRQKEEEQKKRFKKAVSSSVKGITVNSKKKMPTKKVNLGRNYWVEYWDEISEEWICIDPMKGTIDMAELIESDATSPMHYVIAIDNEFGMRDVTARYASKYLSSEVRRLRIDEEWWKSSLMPFQSKNHARNRLETVKLHNYLMTKPMPVTVAEFKNHPLYVLKRDLLKFEAIYPEDQKPVATFRGGIEVYPRSSVYHLQGALNWMKQARSVKPGEKPYKVVKARPNIRLPEEQREPKTLDVFGYWQTEPYVPPEIVDGRIPRNEFGNIYMYKECMLPKGCVHLHLDGLYGLARQMDIECAPAVVGWEFHKGGSHPILDGCVVLAKDAMRLKAAWTEHYEKKRINAEKKRRERAKKNWKRLYRGVLLMRRVHARFLGPDRRHLSVDECLENADESAANEPKTETPINDDMATAWPATNFTLPTSKYRNNDDADEEVL